MPRYKLYRALLLPLLWAPALRAQVLPLDSVVTIMQQQNPMLREFGYKAQAMDTYAKGATSWDAPKIGAGLWMTPYNQAKAQEMNHGEKQGMAMVSVEQMIPNPAKLRARKEYMSAQSSVERLSQAAQFNQLRAQARTLYYERVVLEKKEAVLMESEELLRFLIRLAEVRYPYNQSGLNSIYEAQARLEEHLNDHDQVRNQIRQKTIALNTLMNRPREQAFAVDTTLNLSVLGAAVAADTTALAARRSDLRGIDQAIEVTRLNQKRESLSRKPDFGIQYSHMNTLGSMPNQYTLMGTVSIPIAPWASKAYRANVEAMKYEIAAMQSRKESILNEATGMLTSLQTEIANKKQQVSRYQTKIVPAFRKNYEVSLRAYEQNTASLSSVIDGWNTLTMAQMQYLDVLDELLKMQVAYEKELEN